MDFQKKFILKRDDASMDKDDNQVGCNVRHNICYHNTTIFTSLFFSFLPLKTFEKKRGVNGPNMSHFLPSYTFQLAMHLTSSSSIVAGLPLCVIFIQDQCFFAKLHSIHTHLNSVCQLLNSQLQHFLLLTIPVTRNLIPSSF